MKQTENVFWETQYTKGFAQCSTTLLQTYYTQ